MLDVVNKQYTQLWHNFVVLSVSYRKPSGEFLNAMNSAKPICRDRCTSPYSLYPTVNFPLWFNLTGGA
jgi:hypothetical protein